MCSASAAGNLDELKKAVGSGVSLMEQGYGGRTPLHLAASEGHLKTVTWIVQNMQEINMVDAEGHTALVDAVENGHDDLAKYLRSQGATLDVDFAASMVSENNAQKLKLLFELGADPNINVAGRVKGGARRRRSALHFAASGGHAECVKILMQNWANLNPMDGVGGT
jgi:ankyrin repeat protein